MHKQFLMDVLENSRQMRDATEKHIRNQNERLNALEAKFEQSTDHSTEGVEEGIECITVGEVHFLNPDNTEFRSKDLLRQVIKVFRQHGAESIQIGWKEYGHKADY